MLREGFYYFYSNSLSNFTKCSCSTGNYKEKKMLRCYNFQVLKINAERTQCKLTMCISSAVGRYFYKQLIANVRPVSLKRLNITFSLPIQRKRKKSCIPSSKMRMSRSKQVM
jgi:hypothetical protein